MDFSESADSSSPQSIAEGILAGDKRAERDLFARFRTGMVLMLQRRLTNRWQAEDIANDALSEALGVLRSRPLEDPAKLSAFVRGIALNLARNANRKEARRKTEPDTEAVETAAADNTHDPAVIHMRASLARFVREILSSLPVQRDRDILVRYYLDEEEKHDICRDLQLTGEHFDRVVHRARRRMLELIEQVEPQRPGMQDFLVII